MAVKLSARMEALAALVTPGVRLADVGTDHGYIPVFLCQMGVIPSAIAMDINRGPLQRAEAHVVEFGLEDRIQTRLSNGLEKLLPGEADCILIAGMGGGLIQRILAEGRETVQAGKELILQPQSEIPQTRRFLREHGYRITDEDMVEEDGKFYFLMKAHKVEDSGERMDPLEEAFGPVLLQKKHPVLLRWIRREIGITEKIRSGLRDALQVASDAKAVCSPAFCGPGKGEVQWETSGRSTEPKQKKLMERLFQIEERRRLLQAGLERLEGKVPESGR